MDKYEYKVKEDEIKELVKIREFEEAAEVADTIDWRRVKSVKILCMVSDVYKKLRRYEDSRDMLLLAYERHPGGRTIVYSLCELAIKMGDTKNALEYCKEFVQMAPKDPGRYILQYKLYEAQEVRLEERITVLEELKKVDYREKWAYELAYLFLDFADVQTVMTDKGIAHIGIGSGKGDDKALQAVKEAVASPLLETTIAGASHVIINISGDITLFDASDAAEYVQDLVGEDTNIIFGAMYDDSKADEATITVIATGLHNVAGTASKLKSRLESKVPVQNVEKYEAPVVPTPVMPELDLGLAKPQAAGTAPTLDQPRTPVSSVKEQSIKIPTFLKK